MTGVANELREALTGAYATYVVDRIRVQGIEIPATLEAALGEGEQWLSSTLEELLALPYAHQPRGPLEVFQEAMRFPTEALSAAGITVVRRDQGAAAALPGDLFNLAPASSRQINEAVWLAHLAWGADKARHVQPARRVVLLTANLMDRSRIEPAVARSGATLSRWNDLASSSDPKPDLVIVDLEHEEAMAALEWSVDRGVRVIAFGPHADRDRLERARRTGAAVEVRSAFFADLSRHLA